ncbi:MAG: capsule biosynthesis protein [Pikeienuella sp.]
MNLTRAIVTQEKPVILFLQGPPTGFWHRLADAFAARGCEVIRVNLCAADALFWRRKGAINYRGTLEDWPKWLRALIKTRGVTDILYYADQLPYHREARKMAEAANVRPWVMEFGYLRPDWLTLERGGMGAASSWPRDPAKIRELAADAPPADLVTRYTMGFAEEATGEVLFNLSMVFGRLLYPHYVSDKYQHPLVDYLLWDLEGLRTLFKRRKMRRIMQRASTPGGPPFHLVAMQLQSDYQVRASTSYEHLGDMLDEICASFAANAPADHRLIIKIHPLDNGGENWPRRIKRLEDKYGLKGRIDILKGGDLATLLKFARSVVLANSTVGLHALQASVPIKTLGSAIFDVPGLTHQGSLDTIWTAPEPVDPELCDALVRALAKHIQIKGSFYHAAGQAAAIGEVVDRLIHAHAGVAPIAADAA